MEKYTVPLHADSLSAAPEMPGYSKVVIYAGQDDDGNDIVYEAGTDTGKTLEIRNEWATPAMAERILSRVRGYQYQPFTADKVQVDPTAELGDGIGISGLYGGIYLKRTKYGKMSLSTLGSPGGDETEHEISAGSVTNRQYSRFVRATKSMISQTATQIAAEVQARTTADQELLGRIEVNATNITAKVSRVGGNTASTFGWSLEADKWTIWSGTAKAAVLTADKNGLTVSGTIRAKAGYIGGENGFVIESNKLYRNISTFGGTQSAGVYIGTDGIQLGQGFKVTSGGALTATSGSFGSLSVSNGRTVGTYAGGLSGCGGSVSGLYGSLSTGINVGNVSIGTYVDNLIANKITANYINALFANTNALKTMYLQTNSFQCRGSWVGWNQARVMNADGYPTTITFLGRA